MSVWVWSIVLVIATIVIHVVGISAIAIGLRGFWVREARNKALLDTMPGTVSIVTVAALLLAALHGAESMLWAVAYLRLGALPSMNDAILYSLGSMSTRGSPVDLQPPWRVMGPMESIDGMLLFGISTAFLFALLRRFWHAVENG